MPSSLRYALIAVLVCFASGTGAQPGSQAGAWHGDLASSRAFLVDAAKLYDLKHNQKVTVKALGTMSALEALAQGTVDLVSSARAGDARTLAEQNLEFMPVAWDSLVLLTHAKNPVRNLSLRQLRDIYVGNIKDWSAVGGTPHPINLYAVAGPLDGVEYSLRKILFGNGAAFAAARRWYINTKQLEDAIAIDPDALGVGLLSNVLDNAGLQRLTIEGIAASAQTLEAGQYLLATPLYVVARREVPGQTGSLLLARRAFEFFRSEPALLQAWRDKQLVPFTEAKQLAAMLPSRTQWIATELGIRQPRPVGPPMPPAPSKTTQLNRLRHADQAVALARPAKPSVPQATRANPLVDAAVAKINLCRPTTVCRVARTTSTPAS